MAKSFTVDPERKPANSILLHWFATLYLRLTGWKVVGHLPADKKLIITAGPHTANFDGWMMVMTAWRLRVNLKWMVKAELTRGPLGFLIRAAGGVGIDRKASYNTVQQVVQEFDKADEMLLAVAPEGTRRKLNHWKTGFYWMAYGANVPIYIACLDYGRKQINITHPLLEPSGDIEQDMQVIFDAYSQVTAKHPEKVSEMRLRPSALRNPNEVDNGQDANEDAGDASDVLPVVFPEPPHAEAPDK